LPEIYGPTGPGLEDIANYIENFITERKMMKEPLDARKGVITDFRIPSKVLDSGEIV